MYNLGILLDLCLLLGERVVTLAERGGLPIDTSSAQLCSFLNQEAYLTITHVLVTSYLDYYNMLSIRLPLKTTWKLQLVQNAVELTSVGHS